jgi:hypothetical protein
MKNKHLLIGCSIILSLSFICIGVFVIGWLTWDAYFVDFKDAEAVSSHIFLTSNLVLNDSSIEDVQEVIDSQHYGAMDCSFSSFDDRVLSCLTPKSQYWWYYVIIFTFEDSTLIELDVEEVYRGL